MRTSNPSLAAFSDEDLVNRAQNGDNAAFAELIERHQGTCKKVAFSILRDKLDAEDEVQNACWKAYEHLISATAESRPEIWNPEYLSARLNPWVDHERLLRAWAAHERAAVHEKASQLLTMATLARWIDAHSAFIAVER